MPVVAMAVTIVIAIAVTTPVMLVIVVVATVVAVSAPVMLAMPAIIGMTVLVMVATRRIGRFAVRCFGSVRLLCHFMPTSSRLDYAQPTTPHTRRE